MGKTKRATGSATEDSFHKHYASIWGVDRWHTSLYPALEQGTKYCALVNQYAESSGFISLMAERGGIDSLRVLSFPSANDRSPLCYVQKHEDSDQERLLPSRPFPEPDFATTRGSSQRVLTHWNLDAASVLAVQMLDPRPGDRVLDLCAAPGGKSITISQHLWPELQGSTSHVSAWMAEGLSSYLRSNESNTVRHGSLIKNLKSYLPSQLLQNRNVAATHIDGTAAMAVRELLIDTQGYDKVLVDAPCSSERHIIHAQEAAKGAGRVASEMANWRPAHSKRLAKTQQELLITALKAAKIGGQILYATCSIEPDENDAVIEKVIAWSEKEIKKGTKWTVRIGFSYGAGDERLERELESLWAERTRYGWIVLPDHPGGGRWGPLFFTMLSKATVDQV